MKTYLKIGIFLLAIGIFQNKLMGEVYAAGGCCSGHKGVSCGAGAQPNGRVICNDGSMTSSCLYSGMKMCGVPVKKVVKPLKAPVVKIAKPTKAPIKKVVKPIKTVKTVLSKANEVKK